MLSQTLVLNRTGKVKQKNKVVETSTQISPKDSQHGQEGCQRDLSCADFICPSYCKNSTFKFKYLKLWLLSLNGALWYSRPLRFWSSGLIRAGWAQGPRGVLKDQPRAFLSSQRIEVKFKWQGSERSLLKTWRECRYSQDIWEIWKGNESDCPLSWDLGFLLRTVVWCICLLKTFRNLSVPRQVLRCPL